MATTSHSSTTSHTDPGDVRRHEILGVLCGALTVLLTLALWSYDMSGGENWVGAAGAALAGALVSAFGVGAWLLPLEMGLATFHLFGLPRTSFGVTHAASTVVVVLVGCAMFHLALGDVSVFGGHLAGGLLGEVLGEVMRSLVGNIGAYIVGTTILLVTLMLRTSLSVVHTARRALELSREAARRLGEGSAALWQAWRQAKALEVEELERARRAAEPRIDEPSATSPQALELEGEGDEDEQESDDTEENEAPDEDDHDEGDHDAPATAERASRTRSPGRSRHGPKEPVIVAPKLDAQPVRPSGGAVTSPPEGQGQPFVLPPPSLLADPPGARIAVDAETLRGNAAQLVEKLAAYGVQGRVDEIHPGPVVTMYEFEPASGTKISKIAGLADDLAMALAAQKVRIVAPIPGKARVGFELPNDKRQTVHLRELLEDERWQSKQDHALPVAFGRDISGRPVYADMAKMPHLLVAGATGSGKSVGLNVMLTSLLAKTRPEEVRLLMIDPKVVELAVYDGIPHMLLPVVTDMKKASLALRWAVDEMERRYQLFADAGARNITTYNQRVDRVHRGEMTIEQFAPRRVGKVRAQGANGEEMLLAPVDGEETDATDFEPERLPRILLVVDEFADLMMVAAKDVEAAIARLAQKARAAGIHVILATQRPSVDVITGMIKANFPSRVAFKVSQREDSKVILGRQGAEHLLGMGDMLMLMPGASDLMRVHSAFISEDEVKDVCDFLRAQGVPVYDEEILKPREDDDDTLGSDTPGDDPLYDRAVAIVAQAGYCSISHIQRNLSIGYNKAAKLVERMETEGVVGPPTSKAGGRREVYIEAR